VSRTSDQERGALIAFNISDAYLADLPSFFSQTDHEFALGLEMAEIRNRASKQLMEHRWAREAVANG